MTFPTTKVVIQKCHPNFLAFFLVCATMTWPNKNESPLRQSPLKRDPPLESNSKKKFSPPLRFKRLALTEEKKKKMIFRKCLFMQRKQFFPAKNWARLPERNVGLIFSGTLECFLPNSHSVLAEVIGGKKMRISFQAKSRCNFWRNNLLWPGCSSLKIFKSVSYVLMLKVKWVSVLLSHCVFMLNCYYLWDINFQ